MPRPPPALRVLLLNSPAHSDRRRRMWVLRVAAVHRACAGRPWACSRRAGHGPVHGRCGWRRSCSALKSAEAVESQAAEAKLPRPGVDGAGAMPCPSAAARWQAWRWPTHPQARQSPTLIAASAYQICASSHFRHKLNALRRFTARARWLRPSRKARPGCPRSVRLPGFPTGRRSGQTSGLPCGRRPARRSAPQHSAAASGQCPAR